MPRPVAQEPGIQGFYLDTLQDDSAELREYADHRLARMNALAEQLAAHGQFRSMEAFLFAVHGHDYAEHGAPKSDAQSQYEHLEALFGADSLQRAYGVQQLYNGAISPPQRLYMPRYDTFDTRDEPPFVRHEYSAVMYSVTARTERGANTFGYIGRVVVPSYGIEFDPSPDAQVHELDVTLAYTTRAADEATTGEFTDGERSSIVVSDVRFGADIAAYRASYHFSAFGEAIAAAARTESALLDYSVAARL